MKNIIKVVATGLVIGLASGSFAQTAKVPVDKLTPPLAADAKNVVAGKVPVDKLTLPLAADAKNVVAGQDAVTAPALNDVKNNRPDLEPGIAALVLKQKNNLKTNGFTVKDLLNRVAGKIEMRNSSPSEQSEEKGLSPTERHRIAVTRNAMRNRSLDQHNAAMRNRFGQPR